MQWMLLSILFSLPALSAVGPSQLHGHAVLESRMSSRVLKPGESFFLGTYLDGQEPSPFRSTLSDLLGAIKGVTTETSFQNGAPNSINVLLYYVAFSGFSRSCVSGALKFNLAFEQTMATMMTWPASAAQSESSMQDLWLRVMGYDAPREEYEAWRDFFLTSSYRSLPASETVPAMMTAMMMNPYFLVRR